VDLETIRSQIEKKWAKVVLGEEQKVVVSHRNGETASSVIADLAVAIGAQYIKGGSTGRGSRSTPTCCRSMII
jgi:enolase